ncbi:MAG: NUDIX domain-containing protein [Candidatus Micrarchaeota archaeon]|nr:NUDIX domain-containing protein [Candidatus Micrarchaeota archaeon]
MARPGACRLHTPAPGSQAGSDRGREPQPHSHRRKGGGRQIHRQDIHVLPRQNIKVCGGVDKGELRCGLAEPEGRHNRDSRGDILIVKDVSVAAIIRDRKLLVVRNAGRNIWTLPGGHVEKGETAEQCVLREVKEELGLEPTGAKFFADYDNITPIETDTLVRLHFFLIEAHSDLRSIDPEIEETMWVDSRYKGEKGELINSQKDFLIPALLTKRLID